MRERLETQRRTLNKTSSCHWEKLDKKYLNHIVKTYKNTPWNQWVSVKRKPEGKICYIPDHVIENGGFSVVGNYIVVHLGAPWEVDGGEVEEILPVCEIRPWWILSNTQTAPTCSHCEGNAATSFITTRTRDLMYQTSLRERRFSNPVFFSVWNFRSPWYIYWSNTTSGHMILTAFH